MRDNYHIYTRGHGWGGKGLAIAALGLAGWGLSRASSAEKELAELRGEVAIMKDRQARSEGELAGLRSAPAATTAYPHYQASPRQP